MKAAVIHEFGDVDVLKVENVPTPKSKPGHVLVKVLAAGINRLDHYIREGSIVPELPFPHILGADAVGEVFELGRGVEGLEIGERVIVAPGYATDDADARLRPAVAAAKAMGVIVAYGFAAGPDVRFDIRSLFFGQKQLRGSMASDIEDLEWGLERVKAGKIKPLLDRALPLKDAAEAHRLIANSEVKGNIVLLPWAA